jgi:tight adherence protein C
LVSGLAVTAPEHSKRRTIVQRMVGPSLRSVGRPILRVTPSAFIEATRGKLQEAGEPMSLQPAEFIGIRFGAAMVSSILGIAVPLVGKADLSVAVAGAIPGLVLEAMVRSRKSALRRALPAALDMLALSVEAGLSFDGAVAQVAQRWDTPLSEEFRRLLLQFQIGRDRRQVLREVGLRTGLSEIGRFVNAVIQADSFGAPLSKVLQEQATEIRTRRRQLAEEQARKAPVKMLFPLVLLIFPALFVVILGPAVPRMLAIFGSFH